MRRSPRRAGPRVHVQGQDRGGRVDGLGALRPLHGRHGPEDRVPGARELAEDAGGGEIPMEGEEGRIVARLDPASKVREGQDAELWVDAGTRLQLFDPDGGNERNATRHVTSERAADGPRRASEPARAAGPKGGAAAPTGAPTGLAQLTFRSRPPSCPPPTRAPRAHGARARSPRRSTRACAARGSAGAHAHVGLGLSAAPDQPRPRAASRPPARTPRGTTPRRPRRGSSARRAPGARESPTPRRLGERGVAPLVGELDAPARLGGSGTRS